MNHIIFQPCGNKTAAEVHSYVSLYAKEVQSVALNYRCVCIQIKLHLYTYYQQTFGKLDFLLTYQFFNGKNVDYSNATLRLETMKSRGILRFFFVFCL